MTHFGRFYSISLQFDDCTASSRALTAANWGNRTIRTATRRRHAGRQLLMLPNPHRCRRGAPGEPASLAAVPVGGGGAWLRCPWAVAGPGRASRRRGSPSAHQAPLVWRAPEGPEGLAAVPVGGGGAWPGNTHTPRPIGGRREACGAWPGFETTRRAKLAARTASGRAGRAAAGDLSGQQAATRGADGSRAGRRPRRSPAHVCGKPRPADAGRGFRYPVGYEV